MGILGGIRSGIRSGRFGLIAGDRHDAPGGSAARRSRLGASVCALLTIVLLAPTAGAIPVDVSGSASGDFAFGPESGFSLSFAGSYEDSLARPSGSAQFALDSFSLTLDGKTWTPAEVGATVFYSGGLPIQLALFDLATGIGTGPTAPNPNFVGIYDVGSGWSSFAYVFPSYGPITIQGANLAGSVQLDPIPEPGTATLLFLGLACVGGSKRRRAARGRV